MVRYVANVLLHPLVHFWLVMLVGVLFYWRGSKATGKCFFVYALGWLFLISATPLPSYLAKLWESRYITLWEIPKRIQSPRILILGAGHTSMEELPASGQLTHNALGRLVEGLRLKQQHSDAKLIGSGTSQTKTVPQATVLMNAAVDLGTASSDTLQIVKPRTTEMEAYAYALRFGTDEPVIVVTNALHMRRAEFWFKQARLEVIPAPTNYLVKTRDGQSPFNFKPSIGKVKITASLLHEYAGMLHAKWKTRRRQ